jgi:hypothetical protein
MHFATLSVLVQPPPEPLLRLRPERLQFGVVDAGSVRVLQIEVLNDGAGALELAAPQLDTGSLPAGILTLDTPGAQSIPGGGAGSIALRFAPPFGGPNQVQATLTLRSNDPVQPLVDIPVTAAVASGGLLVTPTELMFPNSPIAANLPQLPPGLPPTVHAGSTRSTTIYNLGAANITLRGNSLRAVDAAGNTSPHFALWRIDGAALAAVDTPLAAGASLTVVVEFRAAAVGAHEASITVRANDPTLVPASVAITGTAA